MKKKFFQLGMVLATLICWLGFMETGYAKASKQPLFRAVYEDDGRNFYQQIKQKALIDMVFQYKGYKSTPLIEAARQGNSDFVKQLLMAGAKVEAQDHHGDTALHKAALFGYPQIVNMLLAARANVVQRNNNRVIPILMPSWHRKKYGGAPPKSNNEIFPPRHGKYAHQIDYTLSHQMLLSADMVPQLTERCKNPQVVSCTDSLFKPVPVYGVTDDGFVYYCNKTTGCKFHHQHGSGDTMCVGWSTCDVVCEGEEQVKSVKSALSCKPKPLFSIRTMGSRPRCEMTALECAQNRPDTDYGPIAVPRWPNSTKKRKTSLKNMR